MDFNYHDNKFDFYFIVVVATANLDWYDRMLRNVAHAQVQKEITTLDNLTDHTDFAVISNNYEFLHQEDDRMVVSFLLV